MRSIAVLMVSILYGFAGPAAGDAAQAHGKLYCESPAAPGDIREISCPLKASGSVQRFSFKANFSGGHDDTTASMRATLDGVPLACEEGSKTSLQGEDGDVGLNCKFSITEKDGTDHVLRVTLLWSHAQYTHFEFDPD